MLIAHAHGGQHDAAGLPDWRRTEVEHDPYVAGQGKGTGHDQTIQGEGNVCRDPITSEMLGYTDEQRAFMVAMDHYKRANRRPFPTCAEMLQVLQALGYRRVEAPGPLPHFHRHKNGRARPRKHIVLVPVEGDRG